MRRALIATAFALLAAGCASEPSYARKPTLMPSLALGGFMAVPHPFADENKTLLPAATTRGETDVAILPVIGLSAANQEALSLAVARAAERYDILVRTQLPEQRTYVLEGLADTSPPSLKWYLRNSYNDLVGAFEIPLEGTGGPEGTRIIGERTAAALARAMGIAVSADASTAQLAEPSSPRVHVGAVTGAPGDGNAVLPQALSALLMQGGMALAATPAEADFTISAAVSSTPVGDGSEAFAIVWQVTDRAGAVAGEINQNNRIPEGSLSGAWGQTAYDIALGAEEGLYDLLMSLYGVHEE